MSGDKQLQTINQKIAERVGEELVDLIGAEDWQALVDEEVRKFKQATAPKIIHEELTRLFRELVVGHLNEILRDGEWDSVKQEFSKPALEKFIGSAAGDIFGAMLSPSMSMLLNDLRNRLSVGY